MDKNTEKSWWQPGLEIFSQVTGWIVGPILIALFLGRYLDEQQGTEPWYFLGLTGVAIIISTIGLVLIGSKYLKKIEQEAQDKKTQEELKERQEKHERKYRN